MSVGLGSPKSVSKGVVHVTEQPEDAVDVDPNPQRRNHERAPEIGGRTQAETTATVYAPTNRCWSYPDESATMGASLGGNGRSRRPT